MLAVGHLAEDVPEMERARRRPAAGAAARRSAPAGGLRPGHARRRGQRFGGIDILVNNAGLTFTYIDPPRFVNGPRKFYELTDEITRT